MLKVHIWLRNNFGFTATMHPLTRLQKLLLRIAFTCIVLARFVSNRLFSVPVSQEIIFLAKICFK